MSDERPILILSSHDVLKITYDLPVPQILETIEFVLRSFSLSPQSSVQSPHRSTIQSPHHTTLFMPSRVESIDTTSIKVVAVPKDGGEGGLPATTLVMDEKTGGVDAVINARSLTALRTAAASTLATKSFLRTEPNPMHLLLFGAGAQSQAHAVLLIATFPTIKRCTIVNRSYNSRLDRLVTDLRTRFPGVDIVGLAGNTFVHDQSNTEIERAVKSASIICTATSSTKPLFPADWIQPRTHVNLVGSYTPLMQEVSSDLIKRAKVIIVDSREACAQEAGELISAGVSPERMVELGELEREIPMNEGDISIFKTVGVGVMDVAIARLVADKARGVGLGTFVPFD